jgi:hypothetical protein
VSIELIENLRITALLKKHHIYKLEKLSKFMFHELNSKSKVPDSLTGTINYDDDMSSEPDDCEYENSDDEDNNNVSGDELKINDTTKFLHKQSAVWLLTDKNHRLSTDMLSQVMDASKNK